MKERNPKVTKRGLEAFIIFKKREIKFIEMAWHFSFLFSFIR